MENENTQETSKTISAAEARRRRILENSNKRLGKITGRIHDEETTKIEDNSDTVLSNGIYPDPEFERDIFEAGSSLSSNNFSVNANQDVFELLKTLQDQNQIPSTGNHQQQQQPQNKIPDTPLSKFIRSKIPIIIIALIVYTFYVLNIERFIGSVFTLLIIWEIFTTAVVFKEPVHQNQLIVLLGMFLGINPNRIQMIMKLFFLTNKIIRDIAIFLFTFVVFHITYNYIFIGESLNAILDKDFNILFSKNEEL